jgi:hypothetical protein
MKLLYGYLLQCVWIVLLCFCGLAQARPLFTFSSIGSAVDSNSRWLSSSAIELNGSSLGFSDSGDNVIYACGSVSGNFDLSLHSSYISDTSSNSECGLMVRVDASGNAPFCALTILQEKGIMFRYRTSIDSGVSAILLSRNVNAGLRIKRAGNNIKLFAKTVPGAHWQNVATYQLVFPSALLAGAVHISHSDTVSTFSVIDSISGFIEEDTGTTSCSPIVYDFENDDSLPAEGFREIANWVKDTSGFIKTKFSSPLACSALIKTPQFHTLLGQEIVSVSWDLKFTGDSTPLINDYGIYSKEQMTLGDRAKITGSRIGSGTGMEIGVNDTINSNVFSLGNIVHKERSSVNGNVTVAGVSTLLSGATVTGTITPYAAITAPLIPVRSVSPGTDSVIVSPNDTFNLVPGHYSVFHAYANSRIQISSGEYHFRSFVTEPEVKLFIYTDAGSRVDIIIQDNFQLADRTVMIVSDTSARSNIAFYSNQDSTMNIGAEMILTGFFYLPAAQVRVVSRSSQITGGIYAKEIFCEPDVNLTVNPLANYKKNEFEVSLINESSSQPLQKLLYTIHRSDYSDSCKDFLFRSNMDTLFTSSSGEKTPVGSNLHFELDLYPTGTAGLLYNNGLYVTQIFDSIPFALTSLTALAFKYNQWNYLDNSGPQLDNIAISCSQDTCSPVIMLENPSDMTVYVNSAITFQCDVESRGSLPVYQWYRNGTSVPWANHATYSIAHVDLEDNGAEFSCRITNRCSEAVSGSAILTVLECTEPLITDQPDDDTVMLGNLAIFSVVAQGLGLKYQWFRNNSVIENATGADYAVNTTHVYNNFDEYRVRVSNGCGRWTLSGSARLVIPDVDPCRIIQHPRNDTLMEDETYQTEVLVICPNSNFSWYKNGVLFPGYTTGKFTYGPVAPVDNGSQFFCIVDNGVTEDTSGTAVLYVRSIRDTRQSVSIAGDLYNGIGAPMGKKGAELFDFRTMLFTGKTGGTPLYTELHKGITVKEGEFTIVLGHGRSNKDLQSIVTRYKELYAEIHAGKNGTFEQVAPRLRLTAAPYAFTSGVKVVHGHGNPDSTAVSAPLGTMYVDEADSNRTWKLGSKGWGKLD